MARSAVVIKIVRRWRFLLLDILRRVHRFRLKILGCPYLELLVVFLGLFRSFVDEQASSRFRDLLKSRHLLHFFVIAEVPLIRSIIKGAYFFTKHTIWPPFTSYYTDPTSSQFIFSSLLSTSGRVNFSSNLTGIELRLIVPYIYSCRFMDRTNNFGILSNVNTQ